MRKNKSLFEKSVMGEDGSEEGGESFIFDIVWWCFFERGINFTENEQNGERNSSSNFK